MSNNLDVHVQLYRLLGSTPLLLVLLGGVIWCLLNASRAPRVSLLVGVALGVHLVSFFALPVISVLIFSLWPPAASDALGARIFVNGLVYSIPDSLSLGLLLWAAFASPTQSGSTEPTTCGISSPKPCPSGQARSPLASSCSQPLDETVIFSIVTGVSSASESRVCSSACRNWGEISRTNSQPATAAATTIAKSATTSRRRRRGARRTTY